MKISTNTLGIKQLIAKVVTAAFGVTLALIMGGVVVAEAAPARVSAIQSQDKKVSRVPTVGRGLLRAVKIKDIQQNGKTPLVQFRF